MQTIYTSVLARRVHITDAFYTLPYEAGWGREALIFVQAEGPHPDLEVQVETSPDGITWVGRPNVVLLSSDHALVELPVLYFGNWLRVMVDGASLDAPARVLIHAVVKG